MFAILLEVPLIEIPKEIHHFVRLGGGGAEGHQNVVRENYVNELVFPQEKESCFDEISKNHNCMPWQR